MDLFYICVLIKGKYYASIQLEVPTFPWFSRYRHANRSVTSTICRLCLGHACTPLHLAKLRVKDNSICECGLEEGSTDQIVFNCPKLNYSLYDILPLNVQRLVNVKCILALVFSPFIKMLVKFIVDNDIKL